MQLGNSVKESGKCIRKYSYSKIITTKAKYFTTHSQLCIVVSNKCRKSHLIMESIPQVALKGHQCNNRKID